MKKALLFCSFLLFLMSFTINDCNILHSGTFIYDDDEGRPAMVTIEGTKHLEYHQDNKYIIESTIKWLSDCEYNTTLVKATLPDFPFKPGTVMNVKVERIDGSDIYYTAKIKDMIFKSKLTKVSQKNTGK